MAQIKTVMKKALPLRLILVDAPSGVDYGVQRGRGADGEPTFVQQRVRGDVAFDFSITVSDDGKHDRPGFSGEFVQGTPARRFIYIDVGTYAGQANTPWSRRMIVPLADITRDHVAKALTPGHCLSVRIPGTAKDGGPNCATVSFIEGWQVCRR